MRRTPSGFPAIELPWMWADGAACWFFVLMRKGQSPDEIERILRHEDVHLRQQRWIYPWWLFRYLTSDHYRLRQEAPAYAQNVLWFHETYGPGIELEKVIEHYAEILHRKLYHLDDTFSVEVIHDAIAAFVYDALPR